MGDARDQRPCHGIPDLLRPLRKARSRLQLIRVLDDWGNASSELH